jgi:hypothetical protein
MLMLESSWDNNNVIKGMFLFAKLMVRFLESMSTREELIKNLGPTYFPAEIERLYFRIFRLSDLHLLTLSQVRGNSKPRAERGGRWLASSSASSLGTFDCRQASNALERDPGILCIRPGGG